MKTKKDQNQKKICDPQILPVSRMKILLHFSASLIAILLIAGMIRITTKQDELKTTAENENDVVMTTPAITEIEKAFVPSVSDRITNTDPITKHTSNKEQIRGHDTLETKAGSEFTITDTTAVALEADENKKTSTADDPAAENKNLPETEPVQNIHMTALSDISSRWPDGFSAQSINRELAERMRQSGSLTNVTPVALNDLSYLTILYYDFNGNSQTGEMIVHQTLAEEVLDIFYEIYQSRFPITSIHLIDDFAADDNLSMAANNSYAFCTRPILGSNTGFSRHSYGVAIDINPVQNPYIRDGLIQPAAGEAYQDRDYIQPGMIIPGQIVHKAFTSRGWVWGGSWQSLKDYHHFEKELP